MSEYPIKRLMKVRRTGTINPPHWYLAKTRKGAELFRHRDEKTVRDWIEEYLKNRSQVMRNTERVEVYVEFDKPHFSVGVPKSFDDPNRHRKELPGYPAGTRESPTNG